MFGPMMPSIETWLKHYITPEFILGSWARHTAGYWRERTRPNMLILAFKEMKADLGNTIRRISDFMGVALKQDEFEAIHRKSLFGYMQSIDDKFHPGPVAPWSDPNGKMMRRGRSGESQEALTSVQRRRIDDFAMRELARLGSDFPYEEYFLNHV
jgi:hypothetical protein